MQEWLTSARKQGQRLWNSGPRGQCPWHVRVQWWNLRLQLLQHVKARTCHELQKSPSFWKASMTMKILRGAKRAEAKHSNTCDQGVPRGWGRPLNVIQHRIKSPQRDLRSQFQGEAELKHSFDLAHLPPSSAGITQGQVCYGLISLFW